jgi:hypothetical protein
MTSFLITSHNPAIPQNVFSYVDNDESIINTSADSNPDPLWMHLEDNSLVVPINGYVTPIVVVITLATNCIVCAVLLRPHMRSPTNALLVAIATSDMLTGVWSVPAFAYFYTSGAHREWVPYRWCYIYPVLTEYIPTVFHTASIWLTVALAVQRYVYVCHALSARQLCTTSNFVRVIAGIFAGAFVSQMSRFFEYSYTEAELTSRINPNEVSICVAVVPCDDVTKELPSNLLSVVTICTSSVCHAWVQRCSVRRTA